MKIELSAASRKAQGTGASRRLRKSGRVPGIVYGGGEPVLIDLDHNNLYHLLRKEAFHASIMTLDVDGKKEPVLLRDFHMHPFRQQVQHIDFQRVEASKKIHMKVPLHFINADIAPGVKQGKGIVSHVLNELDVACLPADLPEFIEVDLSNLMLNHSIHVSDLKLPQGVEAAGMHAGEAVVATIQVPRGAAEAAAAAEPAA
ncbi:50S ribosomal protein L25/general stress protein Ctc [Candidatus Nitrotoga fabula]|uniref:Large ribosomal subunit protein bL25 n=1 Tax=Candidatus Nitrotoga fabula TaxID=2182327 RepID=A0A916BED2_9PROT|nr:50S ribosomal protein L25/general stress protein Ctc [Candidatus Nitrotoga fabula]CAE6740401.1 50S ribosomal protein L25 [Candidatus Nitrotoga fabula]